jgi:hypothetical protein
MRDRVALNPGTLIERGAASLCVRSHIDRPRDAKQLADEGDGRAYRADGYPDQRKDPGSERSVKPAEDSPHDEPAEHRTCKEHDPVPGHEEGIGA